MREGAGEGAPAIRLSCFEADELAEALAVPGPIAVLDLRFADDPQGPALIAALDAAACLHGLEDMTLQSCSLGPKGAAALAASPRLAGLRRLTIGDDLDGAAAAALLASPHLAGLRALSLQIAWDDEAFQALARCPHLGALESLDLGWCQPRGVQLAWLCGAASLPPRLRAPLRRAALAELRDAVRVPFVDAWDEHIAPLLDVLLDPAFPPCPEDQDAEAAALADLRARLDAWPPGLRHALPAWLAGALGGAPPPALAWADTLQLYRLRGAGLVAEDPRHAAALLARGAPRRLDLRFLRLGPYELVRWLRADFMADVDALDLHGHPLTAPALAALERAPGLADLAELDLLGCLRKPGALQRLLRSPLLARLRRLELAHNALGDRGATLLAATPTLHRLEWLGLRDNGIGDPGCTALAAASRFTGLRSLDLSENPIGDLGAIALAEADLPALERLELGYRGHIGDDGACALARARNLPALRRLGLKFCRLGDRGALALVRAVDRLPQLRALDLCHGNTFTPEGAEALAAAAPLRPDLRLDLGPCCSVALRECEALMRSSLARAEP